MVNIRSKTEELRAKLKTILNREYKELAVQELKVIGNGVQNIVFRGNSEKGPLAFRVPWEREVKNINEGLFNSRISLQKEAELSKFCNSKDIPVPKVHGLHLSTELDFLISDYLATDHIPISAYKIGEVVNKIHNMPIEDLNYQHRTRKPSSKYIAERLVKRVEGFNKITHCDIEFPDISIIEEILKQADHIKKLLHMDIRPANLIGHPLLELMRITETNEIDWYEFKDGYKNKDIFESIPRIVSLFYQLDTAVMLANLFIAQLKIEEKGIFYKERVKTLHNEIHRYL
ncbi:aminoglycoside phosphotransferase (plasmid) [Bacillus thuringiensis serovar morrisoni str. 4AA1]|uniref:aminoglycoside phosphotransferase n=1 Tax=Bacillus TaxID=1386 RepID=UPI0005CEBC9C|nr:MULTISPECIES: aminoglycoside phosphotransferase [Bacillus]AJQ62418.1 aminoglycoside phosphotransferase [Bacillus thuringiensis serovar morrisoni]AJQ62608.1 aminoglycoside phosphotransferase [Bacillus thuringiensis serovar morrisoni]MED3098435.1 aminoglycoside phosphotransferase family protein [Bacillus thuringiensis]MRA99686.1 aminoglycoside phosphotransferase family protein [Bacillus thuringiensis]OTY29895.1 aminoglycoside phosphotransferase [Bacillus thuringiensis serovar poloniensis]